ncbi:MAG: hypothetical protein M1823_003832 [Watsoniomyces obsoletus]|nr:MAG: hypothetical protein M1823_003832 [Watsoniomyces obsoletus]
MGPPLPPNPSLVAIALVIDSRNGPRWVFHYPPRPREDSAPTHSIWTSYGDRTTPSEPITHEGGYSSSDSDSSIPESDRTRRRSKQWHRHRHRGPDNERDSSDEDETSKKYSSNDAPWETIFGFRTDALEKILSPSPSYHKKRFELGLEPLTYLGCPRFRYDHGWKKRDNHHHNRGVKHPEEKKLGDDDLVEDGDAATAITPKNTTTDEDGKYHNGERKKEEEDIQSTVSSNTDDRKTLSMFHVVFIMNPPLLEHNIRIKEMYEFIIWRLSKKLKQQQAKSDWVWRESEMILNLKEKGKEQHISLNTLYHNILTQSNLARALSEVYLSISTSKIAHVFLDDGSELSLQIPQVTSIAELPSSIEPQMPGVWVTTANSLEEEEEGLDGFTLAKHFALLLLDDVENILKDIDLEYTGFDNDQPENNTGRGGNSSNIGDKVGRRRPGGGGMNMNKRNSHALARFVQLVRPTMSFLQLSQTHSIPLPTIQEFCQHLISWRRARAIPPLHQRDTYIVSPNANMSVLSTSTISYATRFPSLPSLPKMLSNLSGHPRAYSTLIPSKDHREHYLEILAWLMKEGWITQLRMFAWVKVTKEVKKGVRECMKMERKGRGEDADEVGKDEGVEEMDEKEMEGGVEEDDEETILLEPHKANHLESRWLEAIGDSFLYRRPASPSRLSLPHTGQATTAPTTLSSTTKQRITISNSTKNNQKNGNSNNDRSTKNPTDDDKQSREKENGMNQKEEKEKEQFGLELREAWFRFIKYFNGKHALEKIAVREGGLNCSLHLNSGGVGGAGGVGGGGVNGKASVEGVTFSTNTNTNTNIPVITTTAAATSGTAVNGNGNGKSTGIGNGKSNVSSSTSIPTSTSAFPSTKDKGDAEEEISKGEGNEMKMKNPQRLRRKDVWRYISEFESRGYLVVVRHW